MFCTFGSSVFSNNQKFLILIPSPLGKDSGAVGGLCKQAADEGFPGQEGHGILKTEQNVVHITHQLCNHDRILYNSCRVRIVAPIPKESK